MLGALLTWPEEEEEELFSAPTGWWAWRGGGWDSGAWMGLWWAVVGACWSLGS